MMIRFKLIQNYAYCSLCALLLIISVPSGAQQVTFILIQTESYQPYEITLSGKNYSSSTKGYLVIPQVAAGIHTLNIHFSGETVSDYAFMVEVGDKPRGFSLRQAIDNSWSLFDMVDLTLLKGTIVAPVIQTIPDKGSDAPVKEDKPVDPEPVVVKKDPLPVNKEKPGIRPTAIVKIFDKSNSIGIDQVYVLTHGTRSDTIALFIPVLEDKPGSSAFIRQPVPTDIGQTGLPAYTRFLPGRLRYPLLPK